MKKVIIEARVNEYAMRDMNPNVPWTVQELVDEAQRVREAGASIMHFHARTAAGEPNNHAEVYAEIIEKVREKTDILLLPTLGFNSNDKDSSRIKNHIRTGKEGIHEAGYHSSGYRKREPGPI